MPGVNFEQLKFKTNEVKKIVETAEKRKRVGLSSLEKEIQDELAKQLQIEKNDAEIDSS